MEVQVVHRISVCAEVDLVRMEQLVEDCRHMADVIHVLFSFLLRQHGDVVHMLFTGDDHPPAVALLPEQDHLRHRQFADLDPERVQQFAL